MRLTRLSGVLFATALTAVALAAPAAASASTKPKDIIYHYVYRVVNKTNQGNFDGDYVVCAHFDNDTTTTQPGFACSETVTATSTYSIGGGYTVSEVEGAIGFSFPISYQYSYSVAKTVAGSLTLPAGKAGNIDWGVYYTQYRAGMEWELCSNTACQGWSTPTYVTVQKAIAPSVQDVYTSG